MVRAFFEQSKFAKKCEREGVREEEKVVVMHLGTAFFLRLSFL